VQRLHRNEHDPPHLLRAARQKETIVILLNYAARKAVAPTLRVLYPGYSWCARCGLPWSVAQPHLVPLNDTEGSFALCEQCWHEAPVEERSEYFDQSRERYWPDYTKQQIDKAVKKASVGSEVPE
jgi:hypothetical protein